LPRFFADWLDRPGAPVLDVAWRRAGPRAVSVRVTQRTAPYALPLEIAVDGSAGRAIRRVELRDSVQSFTLAYAGAPRAVRLDPAHRLLLWDPAFGPVPGVTQPWTRGRSLAWLTDEIPWLMRGFGVTAASVAVVENGRVTWTAGFGAAASRGRVTADTRFPADTAIARALRTAAGRPSPGPADVAPLRRLGMVHSGFVQPPAGAGVALPPPYLHTREWPAETQAAAGLWSTAPDLARFLAALVNASAGRAGSPVDPSAARTLLTPMADAGRGMFGPARAASGFLVAEVTGAPVIYRLSYGAGSTTLVIGFPATGAGCVVLVNDERTGPGFAMQVAQRLAVVHGWPAIPR
ncbi:MAG TPA: serine hydrolase, partial [Longimicrobium sp.]|nr:serine hydrolase [Longimicrobium sp.]